MRSSTGSGPVSQARSLDRLHVQRAVVEAWVVRIDESLAPNADRCSAQSIVKRCSKDRIRLEHHVRSLVSETGIDCGLGWIFVPGQASCGGKNTHIICIKKERSTLEGCFGKGRRRRQTYQHEGEERPKNKPYCPHGESKLQSAEKNKRCCDGVSPITPGATCVSV